MSLRLMLINKNKFNPFLFDFCIVFLIFLPVYIIFWNSISGDASIYLTFIKQFFNTPFSFNDNQVSFGASSPLLVILYSPFYVLFGEKYWFLIAKIINLSLIIFTTIFLNKSLKGNTISLIIISLLFTLLPILFQTSSQLFATSLACFMIVICYYFLKLRKYNATSLFSGLLYLTRPELLVIAFVLNLYIFLNNNKRNIKYLINAFIPGIIYHVYIYLNSYEILPSSIFARSLRSLENNFTWYEKFIDTWKFIFTPVGLIYFVFLITLLVIFIRGENKKYIHEFIFTLPILFIYILLPPPYMYISRYILPVSPIIIVILIKYYSKFIENNFIKIKIKKLVYFFILSICYLINIFLLNQKISVNLVKTDYDLILLKDLANKLNKISTASDTVLIYEIQSKYFLKSNVISLDGIVGNQIAPLIIGDESLSTFLNSNPSIKYVVTMNSFNYRKIFNKTNLIDLYKHDLNNPLGSKLVIDKIIFTKVLTNDLFSKKEFFKNVPRNNLNYGETLRIMNKSATRSWHGFSPFWNSVYKIKR